MAIEIERKFLLKDDSWRQQADAGTAYRQGYLIGAKQASVRVRIEGDKAFINIKSMTLGVSRLEYQYPIPVQDAEELLDTLCDKPLVEKTRYRIQHAGHEWEIDVFEGDNAGLVVAEVELSAVDEQLSLPDWAGIEVSSDPRYYNVNLVKHPYTTW
ncbi:MAG: CYTH domain-containing protein [Gammaproteobacteria bacterium]